MIARKIESGPDYRLDLLGLGPGGPLTKFYGFRVEIAIKRKFFFIKKVKIVGKNVFPNILKTVK